MQYKELTYYLDKLESIIDPGHVDRTRILQRKTFAFEPVEHIPTVISYPVPPDEWPQFGFEEIFADREKMLLSELRNVYMGAKLQDDRLYGIRANYGTGIIASMFGCPVHTFDHALPISTEISRPKIDRILEAGMHDIRSGIMGKTFDTAAWFRDMLQPYEKLSTLIGSQCFDIQGPFDNTSIIWGSSIYLAILDEPETIMRLMEIISQTILNTIKTLRQIDGCELSEHDGAWNYLGGTCVRDDSSVNLGKKHYVDFAKPFDEQILREWGGWIHFCGRAHQWWPELLDLNGLKGINPYQGEFYDLFAMYETCETAQVPIVQWTTPVDARCQERIRTGFSRILEVDDFDIACRFRDRLFETGYADLPL